MLFARDRNLMPGTVYATPTDLWNLALPPETLFQDSGLEPGDWSAITKIATGSGSLGLYFRSNPRDFSSFRVKCVVGGELNVDGIANPGPLPGFQISLNAGLTYGPVLIPDENGLIPYIKAGFTLELHNGLVDPSFVAGDEFIFSTSPSPVIVEHLLANSRIVDMYLSPTYTTPPTKWAEDLKLIVCELTRWSLLKRRGLSKEQDIKIYDPKEAMARLMQIANGDLPLTDLKDTDTYHFPMVVIPREPYGTDWRF